jgi:DNA-binding NtrC family response regulator
VAVKCHLPLSEPFLLPQQRRDVFSGHDPCTFIRGVSTLARSSVLVIHEDQLLLDLITIQLTRDGLNAIPTTSCSKARLLIENTRPELVILDASLPDSIDLLKDIRASDQPIAVIVLAHSHDLREQLRSIGVEVVLDRSIHVDGLRAAMRRLIDDEEFQSSVEDLQILVVDDDEDTREILTLALTEWGYSVLTARDGREALQILERNAAISIVLLDIRLPSVGGIEVLAEMSRWRLRATTIMLSGLLDREVAGKAMSLGAFDYVVKPIDLERLKDVIVAALSHREYINRPLWRRFSS